MDFKKMVRVEWDGFTGSGWGPLKGFCEHSNEPSDSIKCREILE
jgi:hypothetical protein